MANSLFKNRLDEIAGQTEAEKEWWEKRQESITAAASNGTAAAVTTEQ